MQSLPLSFLRRDAADSVRVARRPEVVAEYAAALRAGAVFPAAVVFRDLLGVCWLADGGYRLSAHEAVGRAEMPCDVRNGARDDAFAFARQANADHGERRTDADKRLIGEAIVREEMERRQGEAYRPLSDRALGTLGRLSHTFIAGLFRDLGLRERPLKAATTGPRAVHPSDPASGQVLIGGGVVAPTLALPRDPRVLPERGDRVGTPADGGFVRVVDVLPSARGWDVRIVDCTDFGTPMDTPYSVGIVEWWDRHPIAEGDVRLEREGDRALLWRQGAEPDYAGRPVRTLANAVELLSVRKQAPLASSPQTLAPAPPIPCVQPANPSLAQLRDRLDVAMRPIERADADRGMNGNLPLLVRTWRRDLDAMTEAEIRAALGRLGSRTPAEQADAILARCAAEGDARPASFMSGREGRPMIEAPGSVQAALWERGREDFEALRAAGVVVENSPTPATATDAANPAEVDELHVEHENSSTATDPTSTATLADLDARTIARLQAERDRYAVALAERIGETRALDDCTACTRPTMRMEEGGAGAYPLCADCAIKARDERIAELEATPATTESDEDVMVREALDDWRTRIAAALGLPDGAHLEACEGQIAALEKALKVWEQDAARQNAEHELLRTEIARLTRDLAGARGERDSLREEARRQRARADAAEAGVVRTAQTGDAPLVRAGDGSDSDPSSPKATPAAEPHDHLLGTMPDHDVARLTGLTPSIVGRRRRLLKIPAYSGAPKAALEALPVVPEAFTRFAPWTGTALELDAELADLSAARLGDLYHALTGGWWRAASDAVGMRDALRKSILAGWVVTP